MATTTFNNLFRTAEGIVFTRLNANEIEGFEGNYITVINKKAIAVVDGVEVPMPEILFNEVGVEYHFVDYYAHGVKMAKKHGVYFAVKQEPIRIWKNVQVGEEIESVIDGFKEHGTPLPEGCYAAQNVIKNEYYAIPKTVLEEKYRYVRTEFGYDLYEPKADAVSQWAYSDINVFGVLWGGLEFLTTPMINISNPDDCYGCNYVVWWGNDGRLSSYKVLGYFRACGTRYYEHPCGEPKNVALATFEPPKILAIG